MPWEYAADAYNAHDAGWEYAADAHDAHDAGLEYVWLGICG